MRGAERHAAMAAYTGVFVTVDLILLFVVAVDIVGALLHAHLTGDTARFISVDTELRGIQG